MQMHEALQMRLQVTRRRLQVQRQATLDCVAEMATRQVRFALCEAALAAE
jgi:hypothetical protein